MRKPVLTIFYQFNPWNTTIGGIQTLINTFIKYAPDDFELRLVGTGNNKNQPFGRWQEENYEGKKIKFLPLFALENDNFRGIIPTSIKYTLALLGRCYASDFMHFYRLEPTLATLKWQGEKTLFIQNDIHKQMTSPDEKNTILWRRFPKAYFAMERALVGQFNHIFSCNSDSLELYRQLYPQMKDRLSFLKNTFDERVFYPLLALEKEDKRKTLAIKMGLSEDTRFILFAGRLHPQKDPLLLIRSFAALNQANIHLLIAGDGELANPVGAEIEKLGLSERITMLGPQKQASVAELHRISDALVLTSAFEGLPFVVLEALACGIPIVTTDAGETPKLLSSDTGIVCHQKTPESIADALREVVMNSQNYPSSACVKIAQPYAASNVVSEVYSQMRYRWEQGLVQSINPSTSISY
jgi:glycosyltransferase involved in cell wall biosynthesis